MLHKACLKIFFLPDSLADSAKSLIIIQRYFPRVLCYKDSTSSMTRSSCDSLSSGFKLNPFANCYTHWSYRGIIEKRCPCLFKLDNDPVSEWAVLEFILCFHCQVGASLRVATKARKSVRRTWLNKYEYALTMTRCGLIFFWKLLYSEIKLQSGLCFHVENAVAFTISATDTGLHCILYAAKQIFFMLACYT